MLNKKMFRDIKLNLSQFITIFLMVFIGVLAYTGIEAYMSGMEVTADKFYSENNLQDLNAIGTNFKEEDITNIEKINNVVKAEGKLALTANVNKDKSLLINFIEENDISKFYIVKGKKFNKNLKGVWLDNFYATENNLKIGDEITFKYDGFEFKEKIIGFINVPDHIYDVKDESELFPNHENYGFAYLSVNEIEAYLKYKTAKELNINEDNLSNFNYKDYLIYNYIMVDVNKKANVKKIKKEIDKMDSVTATVKIEDTSSYSVYQGEIEEGQTYVGVFSGLFIFIAMLSVITTMTRLVKNQRVQIGTLKALGFKKYKVIFHYINYGFFISLVASILGIIAGYFGIGKIFIDMEMSYFELPNGKPILELSSFIVAILVVLCVMFVTYLTCRKYLKKSPAETLRVEMPTVKKGSLNLLTKGFFKKLSFSSKWNIRDMFRNKLRTIMGIVGISGCCMLIVCAFGMLDSINKFIDLQFEDLYNFKYKLSLSENITDEDLNKLKNTYGNSTSMSLLIEINGESNNIFITDANNLVRFVNSTDDFIKIDNDEGVYITRKLAKEKNLKIGDKITWHLMGTNKKFTSKVVGINKDPQNQNITMSKKYYESLGNTYKPDSLYTNKDIKVKEIKNVTLIQDKTKLRKSMDKMLNTMKSMIVLIIFVAILLGTVIIYNLGILSYSEKEYQFATLKVLGFKDKQIKNIFIKQNNIITIIAIIIGLPLGFYLTDWLFKQAIADNYDFAAHITLFTYLYALIGTFAVSYIVSKYLSRKIKNIDMVSSLKGNE